MSFPAYEEYKDSGISWLGKVPKHWKVVSIKWLSPVLRGASPRPIDDAKYFDEDGEFAWVRIADVSASEEGRLRETTQRLSELGSSLSVKIYPGEIFVSIAGTVGKPCISEIKACIHDGFVYFPHIEINRNFLFRIFESGLCYGGLGKWGTQLNLNTDTVGAIRIPVPPDNELDSIAAFLDSETSKIDALVAEQRRLIELLKEKRQAVISHAVTKGLNPNVKMKPSGIEWLGDVPEHWDVCRFPHVIQFQEGPGIMAIDFHDEGVPLVRVSGVKGRWVTLDGCNYLDPDLVAKRWEHFRLRKGDLVISASASMGIVSEVDEEAIGAVPYTGLIRLVPVKGISVKDFIRSFVVSDVFMKQIDLLKAGATIQHFGPTHLRQITISLPTEVEQREIAQYIDVQIAKFDRLESEAEQAIALLQERRTALISAAVTGKIDVRGFVAKEAVA